MEFNSGFKGLKRLKFYRESVAVFSFNFSLEEGAESFLRYYYTKWGNYKTFIQYFKWTVFKVDEFLTMIWYQYEVLKGTL